MTEEAEVRVEEEEARERASNEAAPRDVSAEATQDRTGELEALSAELEAARAQAAEYLDGWQRARAEFANYKRRQEADRSQMMLLASAGLLVKLLPVVDDFERAFATLPSCLDQLTWVDGLALIKQKLDLILQSEGVTPIEVEGKAFDPNVHEAITYEVLDGFEDGQVIGGVQRGYMLGDRVLRPALVRVAKAPPAVTPEGTSDDGPAEEGADG